MATAPKLSGRSSIPPPPEREFASKPTSCDRRQAAREDGVYAPQIGDVTGGMGEDIRAVLPVFEQVGQSLLGPAAMRVDTPDEGDTYLLELHGTPVQQVEYHEPLAAGELNSGFPMNEPPQGAEAGPTMNKTTAERALSIVGAALAERQAFGSSLAEQGSPRFDIAEAEPDLEPNVRSGGSSRWVTRQ